MKTDYKPRLTFLKGRQRYPLGWRSKRALLLISLLTIFGFTYLLLSSEQSLDPLSPQFQEPIAEYDNEPVYDDSDLDKYNIQSLAIPDPQETKLYSDSKNITSLSYALAKMTLKPGENVQKALKKLDIPVSELDKLKTNKALEKTLQSIQPGQEFEVSLNENKEIEALKLNPSIDKEILITRTPKSDFKTHVHQKEIQTRLAVKEANIRYNLFTDGKKANMDEGVLRQVMEMFAWDIDFAHDLKPGDKLKILVEEKYVAGKKIGDGPILIAEFINQGKSYKAIRFEHNKASGYYSKEGVSLKKSFLRNPVNFSRISSGFSTSRLHPIMHTLRAHKGVDYAAPTGTPVKASGDGQVVFKGSRGGYGNAVILQHGTRYSTLYGHLNNFASNLKVGQYVKQGQVIGYVGSTGLASGPHLHYEFRVDGEHRNPLTVALPRGGELPKHKYYAFLDRAKSYIALLNRHSSIMVATRDQKDK